MPQGWDGTWMGQGVTKGWLWNLLNIQQSLDTAQGVGCEQGCDSPGWLLDTGTCPSHQCVLGDSWSTPKQRGELITLRAKRVFMVMIQLSHQHFFGGWSRWAFGVEKEPAEPALLGEH